MQMMNQNNLRMQSYVEAPELINEGALEGRYRWLYEVPVTISFIPEEASDYRNVKPVNRRYVLKTQLPIHCDFYKYVEVL